MLFYYNTFQISWYFCKLWLLGGICRFGYIISWSKELPHFTSEIPHKTVNHSSNVIRIIIEGRNAYKGKWVITKTYKILRTHRMEKKKWVSKSLKILASSHKNDFFLGNMFPACSHHGCSAVFYEYYRIKLWSLYLKLISEYISYFDYTSQVLDH